MGYQQYAPPPGAPAMEPPEVQSIKSMLHIVRILAIIFGILLLLGGIAYAAFVAWAFSVCGTFAGYACSGYIGAALVLPIFLIIWGVVDFVIYIQMKEIESLVDQRQFEAAKSKTLLWMILGFILGGILVGILLLIAYLKFDPVISWARNQGQAPAMYAAPGAPMGQPMPPPMAAPPPAAPAPMTAPAPPPAPPAAAAPAVPFCSKCGKPTTYIAQYGRYYCYDDKLYV
jgi:predicted lipid-binding transport protein (Tim44 family)